jgi:recombinational DNA repair ATPase RecF
MDEKEIKENAARYVELLSSYEHYMVGMEKIVKKVIETREELVFLESKLKEAGAQIKDVE